MYLPKSKSRYIVYLLSWDFAWVLCWSNIEKKFIIEAQKCCNRGDYVPYRPRSTLLVHSVSNEKPRTAPNAVKPLFVIHSRVLFNTATLFATPRARFFARYFTLSVYVYDIIFLREYVHMWFHCVWPVSESNVNMFGYRCCWWTECLLPV